MKKFYFGCTMNSFRELLESPDVTEEIIRFRGFDWMTTPPPPTDCDSGRVPCLDISLGYKFIPLFVEIGGKRFVNYENEKFGSHIGHFTHAGRFIPLLAEIGGIEWIHKKNNSGRHMGCYSMSKETVELLVNLGGKSWLDQKDNNGMHVGFYCGDPDVMRCLIEAGGPDWLLATDYFGKHIGFYMMYHYHRDELVKIMGPSL